MAVGQLNRYAKGRSDLRPGALNRLLETAGPEEEASLLRAYLLDQCPDDKRHLVEVAVVAATANEDRPDPLAGLPLEVREALRFLGSRCHERPVMDLILNLARLLRRE